MVAKSYKIKLKQLDVKVKLVSIIIFGFAFAYAETFPKGSRVFPQLISISCLILAVLSLVLDFTSKAVKTGEITGIDDTELKVLDFQQKRAQKLRFYKAWMIILFAVTAGYLGGFLFTAYLSFFGFSLFWGERKNLTKNLLITTVLTAVIYVIFNLIMKVPLLSGMLWEVNL